MRCLDIRLVVGIVCNSLSGEELRALVKAKWEKLYDVRIMGRGNKIYLQVSSNSFWRASVIFANNASLQSRVICLLGYIQVMWKYLGQASFPLSKAQYFEQTDAVAEVVST